MGKYLQGYPSLMRKLQKLKTATEEPVKTAMGNAASLIVAKMKSLVPVQYGHLKDSIGWTFGTAPKGSISFTQTAGRLSVTIYAGNEVAFYARWVEFGTAPHTLGSKSDVSVKSGRKQYGAMHPGSTPQPFFYPAFRALRKKAKAMIAKAIREAVKKAVA